MLIGIAGTIGAGKSTLCKKLLEVLPGLTGEPWVLLPEPVTDNPYLALFYEEPKRWAFTMQMFLLLKRYEAACVPPHRNYIQDRTLQEDRIFAKLARKQNLMTEAEFSVYEGYYRELSKREFLLPDLTIYLDVTLETSLARIRGRARPEERGLHESLEGKIYLEGLIQEYLEEARVSPWRSLDWNSKSSLKEILRMIENSGR